MADIESLTARVEELERRSRGYTDELPFEQRLPDVICMEIGDGTAEVMKIIVARELMGRGSLPY